MASHRLLGHRRDVHDDIGAGAVGDLHDAGDRVLFVHVDRVIGTELLR